MPIPTDEFRSLLGCQRVTIAPVPPAIAQL